MRSSNALRPDARTPHEAHPQPSTANVLTTYGEPFSGTAIDGCFAPAAPTPEPSTFLFLGTGILGLAGTARRRFARS